MNDEKIVDSSHRFYAFISYSRKNEKEAKWLQKKLESYRLPIVLQKQYSELPKSLKIFRDKTDIGVGGTVASALSRELRDSKKLIVLCSPESAKSTYVEYEIESFLSLGRDTDDVLPFIVSGEIKQGSEKDCYTPKLHELNLNAADSVQEGKRNAFVRLLASLLGIKYDDLKKRERARTIRKNCFLGTACAVLIAFASAVVWYVTPHTKHYRDCITRWGIPEGLGKPLSKKEVKTTFAHYEITFQYGKVTKLVYANSSGRPKLSEFNSLLERQSRPVIAEYKYNDIYIPQPKKFQKLTEALYTISTETNKDFIRNYKLLLVYSGRTANGVNIDFYYDNAERLQKSLSNNVFVHNGIYYSDIKSLSTSLEYDDISQNEATRFFVEDVSPIYRHKVFYYDDGLEKRIDFFNKNNHLVSDKNGIVGLEFEYDNNQMVEERYLYESYEPRFVNSKRMTYDQRGNLVEVAYCDRDGELINNAQCGFAKKTIEWGGDSFNPTLYSFFDENGVPSPQANMDNCILYSISYDNRGFELKNIITNDKGERIELFSRMDDNGCPVEFKALNGGRQVMRSETEFNADCRMTKNCFYDENGNQALCIEYYYENDSEGQKITSKEISAGGIVFVTDFFDKFSRYTESRVVSENGKGGIVSKINYKGDNRSICFYNADGESYYDSEKGYARADFAYNNDGKLVYAAFKDRLGRATNCRLPGMGFSTYTATYSPNGILLESKYLLSDSSLAYDLGSKDAYYYAITDIDDSYALVARTPSLSINFFKTESGETIVSQKNREGVLLNEKIYEGSKLKRTLLYYYKDRGDYIVYSVDSLGRTLSSEYKDRYGNPKNRPDKNYSIIRHVYYETGEKATEYIDEKGETL